MHKDELLIKYIDIRQAHIELLQSYKDILKSKAIGNDYINYTNHQINKHKNIIDILDNFIKDLENIDI